MSILLTVLGVAVIALVLWDVLITVFSASGAGVLTRAWTQPVWAGLLTVHRRRPIHGLLALAGPAMVLVGILLWYGLLGVGTFLVFSADPASVVRSGDRSPVDSINDVYFVGTVLSGLGYGDLVPSGFPWTLWSSVSALLGTVVLTTSLSYILAVLNPAVQRKSLASGVRVLGSSASEIVETAQLHDPSASLQPFVTSLTTQLSDLTAKHLAFPVLRHFHSARVEASPTRSVLLLSDATFLMAQRVAPHHPPAGLLKIVRSTINEYAEIKSGDPSAVLDHDVQRRHLRVEAERLGIVTGPDYLAAETDYLDCRDRLLTLCDDDGWPL